MSSTVPPGIDGFNHPILEELYDAEFALSLDLLDEILALPSDTLIEDLEWMVQEELAYIKEAGEDYDDSNALFHILMLLGHLRSAKSLPLILEFWKLDSDTIDLVFGDLLYEELWQVLVLCAEQQIDRLKDFVLHEPDVYVFCRVEIIQVLNRIALKNPDQREEIIAATGELLEHFSRIPDENFLEDDKILVSFIANSLSELDAREFLPSIQSLFERKRVDIELRGDWEEFAKEFGDPDQYPQMPYEDVRDWYREGIKKWQGSEERNREAGLLYFQKLEAERLQKLQEIGQRLQQKPKKIGPNDPCPCGSGKKYKKCHGAK